MAVRTMDSPCGMTHRRGLSRPTTDRSELVRRLIESLDEDDRLALGAAGHSEARCRLDEIDRGIVDAAFSVELFRRMWQRLAR